VLLLLLLLGSSCVYVVVAAGKLQDLLNAQAAASGSVAARLLPDPEEGGLSAFVQQQLQLRQKAKQLPAPADAAAADGVAADAAAAEADEAEVPLQQQAAAAESPTAAAAGEGSSRRQQQAGPRLSAVLIDSAKGGEDGGELMRRAVRNLPGGRWWVRLEGGVLLWVLGLSWKCAGKKLGTLWAWVRAFTTLTGTHHLPSAQTTAPLPQSRTPQLQVWRSCLRVVPTC
jgi:uncharacterized membrane protein